MCKKEIGKLTVFSGFLYVLSNRGMQGLLKIGITSRSVAERADELSAGTGVPSRYEIEAFFACVDLNLAETLAHEALRHTRVNPEREFFQVELIEAINLLARALGRTPVFAGKRLTDATLARDRAEAERAKATEPKAEPPRPPRSSRAKPHPPLRVVDIRR